MVRIQLLLETHHLGVPSGASKTIYKPIVYLAQTVHLSCVKTSTISKQTESSFYLILITSKYHRVCPKWFLSIWYVLRKPCPYLAPILTKSLNRSNGDSTWPTSLGVLSIVSKMIFEPMVSSAHTVNRSCIKIRTIPKWIESSFHPSLVT
jgi:hypothetical protein